MEPVAPHTSGSRETRLLFATIAVSLLMLAVLARFRFPAQGSAETAEPAPAPLERLAAQASYDELASTMGELERRVKPSLVAMKAGHTPVVAVRVTADRAVAWVPAGAVVTVEGGQSDVLGRDPSSGIAVVTVAPDDGAVVTPRTGTPRTGPRYVAVVDAPSGALALRPAYVGATAIINEPVTGRSVLSIAAAPQSITPGSPLFTFAGTFIGIAARADGAVTVIPADVLRSLAEAPPTETGIHLGIEVQALTDALARIAGTPTGVMVAAITPGSPAGGVLAAGDVIQSFDSTAVATPQDVAVFERTRSAGTPVKVSFVRRGKTSTGEIPTVVPQPPAAAASEDGPGVTLRTVQGRTTVLSVRERSAAATAGIERGDVIVSVNGGTGDMIRAYRDLQPGTGLLIAIERDGARRIVALEKR